MGYGLDGRGSIPGRGKTFVSTPQRPEDPEAHTASYTMGTPDSFPGGKAAEE
jgi:hypothetical protein